MRNSSWPTHSTILIKMVRSQLRTFGSSYPTYPSDAAINQICLLMTRVLNESTRQKNPHWSCKKATTLVKMARTWTLKNAVLPPSRSISSFRWSSRVNRRWRSVSSVTSIKAQALRCSSQYWVFYKSACHALNMSTDIRDNSRSKRLRETRKHCSIVKIIQLWRHTWKISKNKMPWSLELRSFV